MDIKELKDSKKKTLLLSTNKDRQNQRIREMQKQKQTLACSKNLTLKVKDAEPSKLLSQSEMNKRENELFEVH